ncbi:MAG: hypothetical protein KDE27_11425 [Planctomycetes bacterium]|nr:hypothetical protein [Planctomycetota bacterium]
MTPRCLAGSLSIFLALPVAAQETYWIANRGSQDLMRITAWGSVVERVPMGTGLRSAHVAPDGKVWVVRFIQSTFDIYDPASGTATPVVFGLGNPYDIAFDNQGTAWVSGGTGVEQYGPNGGLVQSIPLANAAPLGITIDDIGNKWIAHRTVPGTITRIDPGNTVMNFPLTGATMQAVRPIADYRGLGMASHIWVTGDPGSGGELVELDNMGNVLNVYPMPASQLGGVGPAYDLGGHIWVGNYSTGDLYEFDPVAGIVANTYQVPPNVFAVSMDSLGRVLAVQRVTFSGVGPPCEVERIDPATGTREMDTLLEFGGNAATGSSSAVSTPFHYSLVVAPFGDMDGDAEVNWAEIQAGTSPIDPCSTSAISLSSSGTPSATNGGVAALDVRAGAGTAWFVGLAFGIVAPGSGISLPGVTCEVLLDPASFTGTVFGIGTGSLSVTIPIDPTLVGVQWHYQALAIAGSGALNVSNVSGLRLW